MKKIIECVPNISEGRDSDIVLECVNAVAAVPGVKVLNFSSDFDHNRSVITFTGDEIGVVEAAVRLCKKASELIDLRHHRGAHPRVGAVDVIPFIPIKGISVDECIELSKIAAKRIFEEVGIPTYLYEKSATASHRENLADIRRGEFEALAQKTKDPLWQPDFGTGYHESAGVSVVGVRDFLIAYNIYLDTDDLKIAKNIAKIIRKSGGGFDGVKAIGLKLEAAREVQVSINIVDYKKAPMYRIVETVRMEAMRYGVRIRNTELIGLVPMEALAESAGYYLQIKDFDSEKMILENYIFGD